MNDKEIERIKLLGNVTFLPGSFDKKFFKSIHQKMVDDPTQMLTDRQSEYLEIMVYKYRRQIFHGWKDIPVPKNYIKKAKFGGRSELVEEKWVKWVGGTSPTQISNSVELGNMGNMGNMGNQENNENNS